MAFWCIFLTRILMLDFGILSLLSCSMECSWMAPLTPVVIVTRGLVFHSLFCILLINGSYLVCLCVNSMSCIV